LVALPRSFKFLLKTRGKFVAWRRAPTLPQESNEEITIIYIPVDDGLGAAHTRKGIFPAK
jgi:hypothetical protein